MRKTFWNGINWIMLLNVMELAVAVALVIGAGTSSLGPRTGALCLVSLVSWRRAARWPAAMSRIAGVSMAWLATGMAVTVGAISVFACLIVLTVWAGCMLCEFSDTAWGEMSPGPGAAGEPVVDRARSHAKNDIEAAVP